MADTLHAVGRQRIMRMIATAEAPVDKTVARFGRLDVTVNNAGTEGQIGPITDQTAEIRTAIHLCAMEIAAAVGNQAGYGTNPVPESLNTTPFPAAPPPVVP